MLKTLKRKIALVAVAGLGFGLVSTVPAFAAITAAPFALAGTGVTAIGDTSSATAAAGTPTVYTRAGQTLTFKGVTLTGKAGVTSTYKLVLNTAADGSGVETALPTSIHAAGAAVAFSVGVTGTFTATAAMDGQYLMLRYDDAADGTMDALAADPSTIKLSVLNAGAPASLSWAQSTREINASSVDYTVNVTPKDSNGLSTILLDSETIVLDITPQTGVSSTQVEVHSNVDGDTNVYGVVSESEGTAAGATTYGVQIDGANNSGAGTTGSTIAGTTYTVFGQLVNSGAAVGSPASTTYTRVSNTAGLTGVISFWNGNTSTATAVTSLSSVAAVAGTDTYVKVVDSQGAMVKGVTVGLAVSGLTGAVSNAADNASITSVTTGQDGGFSTATFRPKADAAQAGTLTTTATISTGASSITATLPMTVTATGTTAASGLKTTVKANNGNGIKAGTASATTAPITSSISTTSFTVTITGLDANKAIKARLNTASNTGTPKIDGTAKNTAIYKVADATGTVTFTITSGTTAAPQHIDLDVDGDVSGAYELTSVITYATATGALTTSPATSTTSFVAVSTTNDIVATVADQFGNAVNGGYITISNTSVPATMTAMTAAQLNTDATGKATMKAIIGSAAGSYVFEVKAFDANGAQIGATSTVSYTATTDGAPGSVTVTGGGKEDALGVGYRVWTSPNGKVSIYDANADLAADRATAAVLATTDTTEALKTAKTGDYVTITVSVKNAAAAGVGNVKVTAKGSEGVYLANSVTGAPTSGTTLLSTMVDTDGTTNGAGTATFYAVATKVGTNTVTFTVGSKSATATFDSVQMNSNGLATTSLGRTLTLNSSTVSVTGNAITQVTATVKDTWGNAVKGVSLAGTITGAAGRFAGGSRSFTATTDATGQVIFELTGNAAESGSGTLTVAGTEDTDDNEIAKFASADHSANVSTLSAKATSSATATLAVTAAAAAANPEIATVKADVKAVSDTVATLSKAVTVVQSSVSELTATFTSQIKVLTDAIAKISRAIAALQKSLKKK